MNSEPRHAGFNSLRSLSLGELEEFFNKKRFDTEAIAARGPSLPLRNISKDDRYLISEMACKTFGEVPEDAAEAKQILLDALKSHKEKGGKTIKLKDLLKELSIRGSSQDQLLLSFDEVLDEELDSVDDLIRKFDGVFATFLTAQKKRLKTLISIYRWSMTSMSTLRRVCEAARTSRHGRRMRNHFC